MLTHCSKIHTVLANSPSQQADYSLDSGRKTQGGWCTDASSPAAMMLRPRCSSFLWKLAVARRTAPAASAVALGQGGAA